MKKNIVSFSGGKDSTAMLLKMLEMEMQIDEIVTLDTSWEFPQMYDHIEKIKKIVPITVIKLDFNFYMNDYVKVKGKNKGSKGYGWCGGLCRWGTQLKKQAFSSYVKEKYNNEIIEYQGIAADEEKRLVKNKDKKWEVKYPLAEWDLTEKECLEYCYKKGYDWDGLYKQLDRVSCWCCRNKNLKELKNIYKHMPEVWQELKDIEKRHGSYRKEYGLEILEDRFNLVENQITLQELT